MRTPESKKAFRKDPLNAIEEGHDPSFFDYWGYVYDHTVRNPKFKKTKLLHLLGAVCLVIGVFIFSLVHLVAYATDEYKKLRA